MITAEKKLGTAELLYKCAGQMGLRPSWVTPGMFAVVVDGREKYINGARSLLNSHASASLAKNKYLTRKILERHDMPNIPFCRPYSLADAELFLYNHKEIIAKPLRGSGGRDIHRITEPKQLAGLCNSGYILEKYITGQELRYLVLNDVVIAVQRSEYGDSVEHHRPLQRISYPRSQWNHTLVSLSIQIARLLDLKFAAVDYLIDDSGRAHILEVNTQPGLKWFHAPTSGPVVDVARHFLEAAFENREEIDPVPGSNILDPQPTLVYS
jgi:glutathione synthase/RimK-type ligase-like ATP-grasp enzyme